ncbi:MAG: thiamine pyrophosphate-binding protein [Solirubrobacterales bacterium]
MTATVAQHLVEALESLGVRTAFGLPGVHNLPFWDALRQSDIRLVGVRHEQTAVYAADGHARASGELGVAITTTGPGAANAVGATGEAWCCGSPVLVIATDIPSTLRRPGVYRGVLHETRDQARMFETVVKGTFRVTDPDGAAATLLEAAASATAAPTGPTYLEIPTDFFKVETDEAADVLPGDPHPVPDQSEIERAAELLAAATRPLVWVGRGGLGAGPAVEDLAARLGAPVLETFGARGTIAESFAGRVGYVPHFPEVGEIWDEADAVLAVGSDFDGTMTQNWALPAPPRLVAVNLLATEVGKAYEPDVSLIGDAAATVARLAAALPHGFSGNGHRPDLGALRGGLRTRLEAEEPGPMGLIADLEATVPGDLPVVVDMCIAGYWIGAVRDFTAPRALAYPIGWGTLGFGFPAAVGTAISRGRTLCVCGDGGFLFAAGELAVLAEERPPLTVLIVDDGGYGMLRFDQVQAGEEPFGVDLSTPDFVGLAESFGLTARRVTEVGAPLRSALDEALADPGPRIVVLAKALNPPETTSPRWYRRRTTSSTSTES